MKAQLVRIGNSRGIRIPKALIEQTGLSGEVELIVQGKSLLIRSPRHPRAGWANAFRAMAVKGDDRLLDGGEALATQWDLDGWSWE